MAQTTVLKVGMSCQGCVGAVKRVLTKLEGVESFDVDIDQQKVTVVGNVDSAVVFEKVSKTGKKTEYWKEEAETKEVVAPVAETPAATPATEAAAPADPPAAAAAPAETPAAAAASV